MLDHPLQAAVIAWKGIRTEGPLAPEISLRRPAPRAIRLRRPGAADAVADARQRGAREGGEGSRQGRKQVCGADFGERGVSFRHHPRHPEAQAKRASKGDGPGKFLGHILRGPLCGHLRYDGPSACHRVRSAAFEIADARLKPPRPLDTATCRRSLLQLVVALGQGEGKWRNGKRCARPDLSSLGMAGCGPLNIPYINAYAARPHYQTDGAIGLNGGNFKPSTKYNLGIFTNGAPRIIGSVQSDQAAPSTARSNTAAARRCKLPSMWKSTSSTVPGWRSQTPVK